MLSVAEELCSQQNWFLDAAAPSAGSTTLGKDSGFHPVAPRGPDPPSPTSVALNQLPLAD